MLAPITISLLSLLGTAASQLMLSPDSCVDPQGYSQCVSDATSAGQQCFSQNCNPSDGVCSGIGDCYSSDPNCVTICTSIAYTSWLNCAVANCWNMAYSCEYQNLVVEAVRSCGFALQLEFPPYFPPPANAPGACSCAIGEVYLQVSQFQTGITRCQNYVGELSNEGQLTNEASYEYDCACCAASKAVSIVPALCPNTDSASITFLKSMDYWNGAISNLQNQHCQDVFSQSVDCTAAPINFTALPNNGEFYDLSNLPSGSLSISDTPGSLAAPTQATITWSFVQGNPPVTAVAASASGSGSGSGGSGSSSSGSTTGSAVSARSELKGTLAGIVIAAGMVTLWLL